MATMRCRCGTVLRDDDPALNHLLFSRGEFDVDQDSVMLLGRGREVWRCPVCGRLWVFWEPGGDPTEYLRAPG